MYMEYENELYHYGVKGMKWGVRHDPKVEAARQKYKAANKEWRKADNAVRNGWVGIKQRDLAKKSNKLAVKRAEAKVNYAKTKARAKGKDPSKAELRAYTNAMGQHGIRDSWADKSSNGQSTAVYKYIKQKKGKAYADRIERRVQNRAYTAIAVGTAVMVGQAALTEYMIEKDYY